MIIFKFLEVLIIITYKNNIELNLFELKLIADNLQMAIDDLTGLSLNFMLKNNTKKNFIKQCNLLNNLVEEDIKLFNKLRLTELPKMEISEEYIKALETKNHLVKSISHLILTFERNYEYCIESFSK